MSSCTVLSCMPGAGAIIRELIVEEKRTLSEVSRILKETFPQVSRGLSERSVRRYCATHGIHKTSRLKDSVLDKIVRTSIDKVGPTYGRKMMTGFLSAEGFRVAQKRVGNSLKRMCPLFHNRRVANTHKCTNPVPYFAKYAGEKLHIDQNENGMIVGFVTMPTKNNVLIYEELYLNILMNYGLWDQLRIDHGREWYLTLFIQQKLAEFRNNTKKPPFIQTSSKKNHIVERIWSEVNSRVNYPIKAVLVEMIRNDQLNIDDNLHLFCTSWLSVKVSFVGVQLFVESWNHHPIPGRKKGSMGPHIPYLLMQRNRAVKIQHMISPHDAVHMYRMSGGKLTEPDDISDPLLDNSERQELRLQSFLKKYPSFDLIFHNVVNGNGSIFVDALLFFIDLTFRLESSRRNNT